ncbi:hypothetical protein CMT75_18670 [Elizabethkingia anophelis]|nr:hypothetical protein [Elizabethkingia anophelis]
MKKSLYKINRLRIVNARKRKYKLSIVRKNILLTGETKQLFNESSYNSIVVSEPNLAIYNVFQFFREKLGIHINISPYGDLVSWSFNVSDIYNDPRVPASCRLAVRKNLENRLNQKFVSYFSAAKASIKYANTIFNKREHFKFIYNGKDRFNYSLSLHLNQKCQF